MLYLPKRIPPVEVVPANAMKTEGGMNIAPPIVNLSTVLRRVVNLTHQPLYFLEVRVLCTN